MSRSQHRRWNHGRRRGKRLVMLVTGLALGALLTWTQVSSAQAFDDPGALARAARIPNDQGPPPECAGSPAPAAAPAPAPAGGTPSPAVLVAPKVSAAPSAAAQPASTAAEHDHHGDQQKRSSAPDRCHADLGGPVAADFVDIRSVSPNVQNPAPGRNASTGTFVSACGTNDNEHRNPDNFIVAPGVSNGAHHTHDYVGNVSTDGFATNDSLAAADTTCRRGDTSTYFWPVLRQTNRAGADATADGGGNDGNVGRILRPTEVKLEFRGNPRSRVVAMPRFLRVITGDAKATTNGPANARAQWTCTGFTDRVTTKYPLCPADSQVQRILDFPSCWDGKNTDSANHRGHILFPAADGLCPRGTTAVPQLRMTLTFRVPQGQRFALDSFPEQLHNPLTDHADFANVMPDELMASVVDSVNRGRRSS